MGDHIAEVILADTAKRGECGGVHIVECKFGRGDKGESAVISRTNIHCLSACGLRDRERNIRSRSVEP